MESSDMWSLIEGTLDESGFEAHAPASRRHDGAEVTWLVERDYTPGTGRLGVVFGCFIRDLPQPDEFSANYGHLYGSAEHVRLEASADTSIGSSDSYTRLFRVAVDKDSELPDDERDNLLRYLTGRFAGLLIGIGTTSALAAEFARGTFDNCSVSREARELLEGFRP